MSVSKQDVELVVGVVDVQQVSAAPPARKPRVFAAPKLDPAKPLIDAMLPRTTAHRKQQHAVADVSYASSVTTWLAGAHRSRPRPAG